MVCLSVKSWAPNSCTDRHQTLGQQCYNALLMTSLAFAWHIMSEAVSRLKLRSKTSFGALNVQVIDSFSNS